MPSEPNDKMDELLKAYADRRRKEAGAFEMHPATRQMLQAEVTRVIPRTTAKTAKPRFFSFGRLFLYGSGLAAAMICAALLIKEQNPISPPAGSPQKIAALNSGKVSDAIAMPSPQTGKLVTLNNSTLEQEKFAAMGKISADKALATDNGSLAMQTDKDSSLAEAAKPATAPLDLAQNNLSSSVPGAAPMPPPLERASPVQADQILAAQASQQTKEPAPASPAADAVTISHDILTLFEIRLIGDQIKLIDADGSIYIGKIDLPKSQQQQAAISKGQMFANHAAITQQSYAQIPQQSTRRQQSQVQAPSGVLAGISNSMPVAADRPAQQKSDETTPGEQGYSFRASGDCHSLGRFVTVEGTYYTALPQEQLQDLAQAKKQVLQDARGATGGASTAGRIQAQAQIGNNMRIDINAISVPLKVKSN